MKILLIDDHALFREGVALLLRPLVTDIEILEAGTCEEAFALLSTKGPVELVLIDLGLPQMSGIDGIVVLRQRYPDVPIVALSSSDDKDTVLRALDAGAMGFIPKSSSSAVLIGALKLIMAKGIYLPPEVFLGERRVVGLTAAAANAPPRATPTKTVSDLGLTVRQAEVLYRILQGKPAKSICRELGLSASSVKAHTSAVLRALNVTTRTQAVVVAGKLGLRFADDPHC